MKAEQRPSPWPAPEARARGRADKRDAVLRAAARLFNEKGFHASSLDELAERLNVTKPTLYYYVKNKDEILFACVHAGLAAVRAGIDDARRAGGSSLHQLRACMRAYAEVVMQDFGMCVIRVGEDPLPIEIRRKLRGLKSEIDLEFRRLIEQGMAEGLIARCDAKLAAFTIAGALSWIGRWYRAEGDLPPPVIAQRSIDLLLGGVLPRPGDGPAPVAASRNADGPSTGQNRRRTGLVAGTSARKATRKASP